MHDKTLPKYWALNPSDALARSQCHSHNAMLIFKVLESNVNKPANVKILRQKLHVTCNLDPMETLFLVGSKSSATSRPIFSIVFLASSVPKNFGH